MIRECDICGMESDEYWMKPYHIGAKTIWLCWDCYRTSQREITLSEIHRQRRLHKLNESKKVKK